MGSLNRRVQCALALHHPHMSKPVGMGFSPPTQPATRMPPRQRTDQALVDRGLVESRTRAQALIMAGKVFSGDRRIAKPGEPLPPDAPLEVRGQDHPWASRGGLKLDHALSTFGLSPQGRTCLDIGASTGGFTSVLLHHGATKVYAVDVGHGQLAWSLRTDPRVVVLEKTNARRLATDQVPDPIAALVCDASFIGLRTVLPAPLALCTPGAWAVALIKPNSKPAPPRSAKAASSATPPSTKPSAPKSKPGGPPSPTGPSKASPKAPSPAPKATSNSSSPPRRTNRPTKSERHARARPGYPRGAARPSHRRDGAIAETRPTFRPAELREWPGQARPQDRTTPQPNPADP